MGFILEGMSYRGQAEFPEKPLPSFLWKEQKPEDVGHSSTSRAAVANHALSFCILLSPC